jgi:preprotein translocase subunit SecE
MNALAVYLRESIEELKKIVWPTREETLQHTIYVIVISLIVAGFLGGADYVFNTLLKFLLK